MDPGSLLRLEISKGWGQVQSLHDKIELIASLDEGESSSCYFQIQDRAALVDETARIISTFTNVIAYLTQPQPGASPLTAAATPPAPASESSQSDEDSRSPKKRKSSVKQSGQQLQAEIIPDDGHSWRKYGQKDILGSRHPKSYYRCTHKRESGCPAIKYVQRSDSDPASFHITYKGEHICRSSQQSPRFQAKQLQVPLNSACLRINSDGALQITPSGPTLTPSASFSSDTKVSTHKLEPKPEPELQQQQQHEITPQSDEVVSEHNLSLFDLSFFLDNSPDCLDLSFQFDPQQPPVSSAMSSYST